MRLMLVAVAAAIVGGCSGSEGRCLGQGCPPLAGSWALVLQAPAASGTCTPPALVGDLTIGQEGATLSGSFAGVALTGTAFDTFDFTLHGTAQLDGGSDDLRIKGRYLPSGAADGGASLSGTLTGSHERSQATGPQSCGQTASFSGPRR